MREILEKVKNGVLDAVFPAVCVGCGKGGNYICTRCEGFANEAAPICPVCQQSSFSGERHSPASRGNSKIQETNSKQFTIYKSQNSNSCATKYGLDGLVSCWEYEGAVKSLLHDIKYTGVTHAAKETIQRVFIAMMQDILRFQPFLSFLSLPETFITYVPMHMKKERFRGFNQAAVFAKELGLIAKRPVLSTLEKLCDTKPQIDLKKEERLLNVKGAFAPSAKQDFVGVRSVVLVDDIWTTGATMKECCRVLKSAGVEQVWGFTIARTP